MSHEVGQYSSEQNGIALNSASSGTMNEKHTPGPWKWTPPVDTENRALIGNESHLDRHGKHVPMAYLHEGWRDETIKRANMSLIAAAPALLDACKGLLLRVAIAAIDHDPIMPQEPEIIAAQAAIALAEKEGA